ncbi:MAG TPA: hypothetical protein VG779_06320 [Actinomycetota bacterium]|nr:hypothetical protein [Actinomycetota bacterium]
MVELPGAGLNLAAVAQALTAERSRWPGAVGGRRAPMLAVLRSDALDGEVAA